MLRAELAYQLHDNFKQLDVLITSNSSKFGQQRMSVKPKRICYLLCLGYLGCGTPLVGFDKVSSVSHSAAACITQFSLKRIFGLEVLQLFCGLIDHAANESDPSTESVLNVSCSF
jgi:hypothetical protein